MTITIDQLPVVDRQYRHKATGEHMTCVGIVWTPGHVQQAVFQWKDHGGQVETMSVDMIRACREMEVVK